VATAVAFVLAVAAIALVLLLRWCCYCVGAAIAAASFAVAAAIACCCLAVAAITAASFAVAALACCCSAVAAFALTFAAVLGGCPRFAFVVVVAVAFAVASSCRHPERSEGSRRTHPAYISRPFPPIKSTTVLILPIHLKRAAQPTGKRQLSVNQI
jgi:hypothetical protein